MAIGDLDGDGKPDLAVANFLNHDVSVLLGNGDGTFAAQRRFAARSLPQSVAIGDLDGDGNPDLAVANASSDDVSILLGNGDGTFAPQRRFAAGDVPLSVAIGDLNGDGNPDVAVANQASGDVSILVGHGDGTFAGERRFAAGVNAQSVAIGDLDRDGNRDVAVATSGGFDVSVLLNQSGPAPGDLNCDGLINALDIEPFVLALFDPAQYPVQYPDCDINLGDINDKKSPTSAGLFVCVQSWNAGYSHHSSIAALVSAVFNLFSLAERYFRSPFSSVWYRRSEPR